MMKKGTAESALNKFYNTIFKMDDIYPYRYHHLNQPLTEITNRNEPTPKVSRLVVSDCAVLYVDNQEAIHNPNRDLSLILNALSKINRRLIDPAVPPQLMTTAAIKYGDFKYIDKLEDEHIEKSFFYGQTYVDAYLKSNYRSREGFCRIYDEENSIPKKRQELPFSRLQRQKGYYVYYWMVERSDRIQDFRRAYLNLDAKDFLGKASLILNEARSTNRRDWQNL
jgi:hypothetical protein